MRTEMAENQTDRNLALITGVVMGSAIAAGLVLYFRPRLRQQVTESLTELRDAASAKAQTMANNAADVVDRVADAADDVTKRAQEVRNGVASAVQHGAHAVSQSARQVERLAKASRMDHQA